MSDTCLTSFLYLEQTNLYVGAVRLVAFFSVPLYIVPAHQGYFKTDALCWDSCTQRWVAVCVDYSTWRKVLKINKIIILFIVYMYFFHVKREQRVYP
ncbi:hypothetical protein FKM82_000123 [Ascaphus truei]